MASRRETHLRLARLSRDLLELRRRGGTPGEALPPVRSLAETYQVSIALVRRELAKLQEQGVVHSIPRVGTFVGPPQPAADNVLVLVSAPGEHFARAREAFEARATQLGRVALVLSAEALRQWRRRQDVPAIGGLFEFTELEDFPGDKLFPNIPRVRYGDTPEEGAHLITFDDAAAAHAATAHLQALGHTRIGYLGVHSVREKSHFRWSVRRLDGYLGAVKEQGGAPAVFLPEREADWLADSYFDDAEQVITSIESTPMLTALVVSTQLAWLQLLDRTSPRSRLHDLAVVTFDYEMVDERSGMLTTMRLPWDQVGSLAAELLHSGEPAREHHISMELIPRLSSLRPATPLGARAERGGIAASQQ